MMPAMCEKKQRPQSKTSIYGMAMFTKIYNSRVENEAV